MSGKIILKPLEERSSYESEKSCLIKESFENGAEVVEEEDQELEVR